MNSGDVGDRRQQRPTRRPTSSGPTISLASNDYKLTELLRTGIVQLNSDWTDNASRPKPASSTRRTRRGQDPELGRGFSQFKICTAPNEPVAVTPTDNADDCAPSVNPAIYFGPDISRQTNSRCSPTRTTASFLIALPGGQPRVQGASSQYVENRTTNAFLQYSGGAYYFDSIADFQNAQRQRVRLSERAQRSIPTAASRRTLSYGTYTFGLQDDWKISPCAARDLRCPRRPRTRQYIPQSRSNQNFVNRNGFSNAKGFGGLYAIQPRLSFDYKGIDRPRGARRRGHLRRGHPGHLFLKLLFEHRRRTEPHRCGDPSRRPTTGANGPLRATLPYNVPPTTTTPATDGGLHGSAEQRRRHHRRHSRHAVNTFLHHEHRFAPDLTDRIGRSALPPAERTSASRSRPTISSFGINFGVDYPLFEDDRKRYAFVDLRSIRDRHAAQTVVRVIPSARPRARVVQTLRR